ncbi:unnamed protein product [Heligmosomoides polygyrus]|uniref:N-acetyltransferase domain-containing protein n=1 Tax=Heligmosomoides polygyrus TaxID=6339 RepID=A0A183FRT4_HELPZ|nr:unnamed protein product [Heligmosomoides polygyrus]
MFAIRCKREIVGALTIGANAFLSPPECPLLGKQHSLDDADRVLFFLGVTLQPAFHRIRHNIRYQCDYEELAWQDLAEGKSASSANSSLIRLHYESPVEAQGSLIEVIGEAMKLWEKEFSKMKDLVQFGCNHRKDEQRDKVVCYFKATYAAPEAGSGKKRRGFIEYIRSLFRG